MKNLFTLLEKSYTFNKQHNIVLSVFENILGLIVGGLFGYIITTPNTTYTIISISGLLLLVYLIFRRLYSEFHFSTSALGELKAQIVLEDNLQKLDRKDIINKYIDIAIKSLNSNTCSYGDAQMENNLCDSSIQDGFVSVCQPYVENPQILLNCGKAQFTVGVYFNSISALFTDPATGYTQIIGNDMIVIPRDDLSLHHFFDGGIMNNTSLSGTEFYLQKQLQEAYNNEKFVNAKIEVDGCLYTCITSPIPNVCEDACIGVVFIICEDLQKIPDDADNIFLIFNRLLCNWIGKYEECLDKRQKKMNGGLTTP